MLAQVTGFLMHFGLGEAFAPGGGATLMQTQPFDGNPLTSDPVRYQRALAIVDADPAIGVGGATIGWVNARCAPACGWRSRNSPTPCRCRC